MSRYPLYVAPLGHSGQIDASDDADRRADFVGVVDRTGLLLALRARETRGRPVGSSFSFPLRFFTQLGPLPVASILSAVVATVPG